MKIKDGVRRDNRTGQVEVIPFRQGTEPNQWEVLMLKRNEERGGFWQPVTGGIMPGEAVDQAAYREINEELGATAVDCLRMIDDNYTFTFEDVHGGVRAIFAEHVLAVILRNEFRERLSEEHVDSRWTDPEEALKLLKYDSNKNALNHYLRIITTREQENV